jgi:hypothetical protein
MYFNEEVVPCRDRVTAIGITIKYTPSILLAAKRIRHETSLARKSVHIKKAHNSRIISSCASFSFPSFFPSQSSRSTSSNSITSSNSNCCCRCRFVGRKADDAQVCRKPSISYFQVGIIYNPVNRLQRGMFFISTRT